MPITLVGPNPAQPFDIQTQQAQLAQAQQLALALLQQELGPSAPTIRTAAGNPFGRDVVNLEPIGNALGAMFTQKRLGSINEQQQALAQAFNESYLRDRAAVNAAMRGEPGAEPDVMGEGGKYAPTTALGGIEGPQMVEGAQPGSISRAIDVASLSLHPKIQGLADTLMGLQAKFAADQALTPERLAAMGGQFDPADIARMQRTGLFGQQYLPGGAVGLGLKPVVQEQRPGSQTVQAKPGAGGAPGTATPISGPNIIKPQIIPAEQTGTGAPATVSPSGEARTIEGPKQKALGETQTAEQSDARASRDAADQFIQDSPKYEAVIQLAKMAAKHGSFGSLGNELQEARRLAIRLGVDSDEANKVGTVDSLMKLALPAAAHAGRLEVGGRYTQLEFFQFLKAGAATMSVDPRAALNIYTQGLLDRINHLEYHNNTVMPRIKSLPDTREHADVYSTKFSAPAIANKFVRSGALTDVVQDPETGMWENRRMTQPETTPSGSATGQMVNKPKLPRNFTLE